VFKYDLDGDVTSEQRHFVSGAGPTQKWYDGADRLVEVRQPTDVNDFYTFPWTTRYLRGGAGFLDTKSAAAM
jgi:hypothetical protein